jgi:Uma2 family endonuclease
MPVPSLALALPPPLHEGDRLNSAEFLYRWEAMPDLKYAELLDGVVFMASPLAVDHGTIHFDAATWLGVYRNRTPGCQGGSDTTWVMGSRNTPQPDLFLRVLPEHGGQSTNQGKYGSGAPELILEVSGSSLSRDYGIKMKIYREAGVREYITVDLSRRAIVWRQLVRSKYREREPDEDGILCSQVFPGLWLDPKAFWKGKFLPVLERGLASPEHAAFVAKLSAKRKRK